MTDFDLEIEGEIDISSTLEELEVRGQSDREYKVGTTTEYGQFLEFGTRHMPPYPWFRPAIRELQANTRTFLGKNTEITGPNDVDNMDELLLSYAAALERQMKRNVNAQGASGRSPGTHPQHPSVDTGNLINSIQFRRIR